MSPMRHTGAEIVIRLLERQGVSIVAGIPGGANLPLYDALSRSQTIRHVLARHEQGAGFIAQGMARATGRPAVCFATSGPGAANLMTALADAKLDSVPVVCITGQVPRGLIGTDAFQELDIYGMSAPIAKHNYLVRSAAELLRVIPEAFRIAASGRPGPVLVDIPRDVQTDRIEFESWPAPGLPAPPPAVDAEALALAATLINGSRRPMLYLGGGVIQAEASDAARRLAEKASAPAVMTLQGLGAMPAGHPLELGMLGMHAAPCANLALEECDLLVAVGARFDDRATGKVSRFCPDAAVVHIDIDPGEIDKIKTAHVGLVGDARHILEALLPMAECRPRQTWLDRTAELKRRHPPRQGGAAKPRPDAEHGAAGDGTAGNGSFEGFETQGRAAPSSPQADEAASGPQADTSARPAPLSSRNAPATPFPSSLHDPRTPHGLISLVADLLGDDAIIATDVGQHQMWTAQTYPFVRPRRWLTSGGLGTMGFGLPAAIGASLACPDKTVVCFSGDGSILMNIQELATAVEERANIKIIVLNNGGLGLVRQQQDLFFDRNYFASSYASRIDFPAISRGFGMRALDLAEAADPRAALAEILLERGPRLIHAPIDSRERVFPMVPPGGANTDMIKGESHADACA